MWRDEWLEGTAMAFIVDVAAYSCDSGCLTDPEPDWVITDYNHCIISWH